MKARITVYTAAIAIIALTGCSSTTRSSMSSDVQRTGNAAAETVTRNVATQQGEEQFKNAKQELAGPLVCTAKVADGAAKVDVTCTGKTKTGGAATLTGTTSELPGVSVVSLNGNFVGSVDGAQVFSTQRLGG